MIKHATALGPAGRIGGVKIVDKCLLVAMRHHSRQKHFWNSIFQ